MKRLACVLAAAALLPLAAGASAQPPRVGYGQAPVHLQATQLDEAFEVRDFAVARLAATGRTVLRDEVVVSIGFSKGPTASMGSMPDITGDGRDDVLEIDFAPRRYVAREGRTGRVLWTLPAERLYGAAYARLGSPARPALVAESWSVDDTGRATTGVVALDAGTGRQLWAYTQDGLVADGVVGYADAGLTFVGGIVRRPDGVDDVLLETGGELWDGFTNGAVTVPVTVDGTTGQAGTPGAPLVAEEVAWASPVGDVDGDRYPDYALAAGGSVVGQVSVRSGATHTEIWQTLLTDPNGSRVYAMELPGRGVLVVQDALDGATTTLHDGATGDALWSVGSAVVQQLGRVDGDRVPDLLAFDGSGFGAIGFRAVSGATGKGLWSTTVHPVQGGGDSGYSGWSAGPGGDLDGDGVQDAFVSAESGGRHPQRSQVVVSGRTGRQHTYRTLLGQPLFAPLRGHRDALVDLDAYDGRTNVTATDLRGRAWSRAVPCPGCTGLWFLDHGALTRRGAVDPLLSTTGTQGSVLAALDGRTGRALWQVLVPRA